MITCECFGFTRSAAEPFSETGAIEREIGRELGEEELSGEKASATGEKRKGEYGEERAASVRRRGLRKETTFIHWRKNNLTTQFRSTPRNNDQASPLSLSLLTLECACFQYGRAIRRCKG